MRSATSEMSTTGAIESVPRARRSGWAAAPVRCAHRPREDSTRIGEDARALLAESDLVGMELRQLHRRAPRASRAAPRCAASMCSTCAKTSRGPAAPPPRRRAVPTSWAALRTSSAAAPLLRRLRGALRRARGRLCPKRLHVLLERDELLLHALRLVPRRRRIVLGRDQRELQLAIGLVGLARAIVGAVRAFFGVGAILLLALESGLEVLYCVLGPVLRHARRLLQNSRERENWPRISSTQARALFRRPPDAARSPPPRWAGSSSRARPGSGR